ncbi:hypothetical protein T492DRAFT_593620, partial [Pavlovales sp. CCMP2436]
LTPFQGDATHRVYGKFECRPCSRYWESASTWRDKWQACQSCETRTYPYDQYPLAQGDHTDATAEDNRRPHDMARCERCRELGRLCAPRSYYAA